MTGVAGGAAFAGVPTLHRFDRWGARLGILRVLGEFRHEEEVGGDDFVTFSARGDVGKGERIVWRDGVDGPWREHVVVRVEQSKGSVRKVRAEASIGDLEGLYIEQLYLKDMGAADAFAAVLGDSGWTVSVDDDVAAAGATVKCWLYHVTAWAAVEKLVSLFGVETWCEIVVSGSGVASRLLHVCSRVGGWRGARVEYAHNMAGCVRTVLNEPVVTALYGWGAGLPVVDETGTWHGGYSRKLSFADVNGGVAWVGDEDARLKWGRLAPDGTKRHVFGDVVFSSCSDAEELLALTKKELALRCVPSVSYVVETALFGWGTAAMLGDDVLVVDSLLPNGRAVERARKRVRRFVDGSRVRVSLTLGTVEKDLASQVEEIAKEVVDVAADVGGAKDDIEVIGDIVVPDPPEPEPAELMARALMLDDGTMEFTYLESEESPSDGTVSEVFEVPTRCEDFSTVPWHASVKSISAVRIDSSFAGAGITGTGYWFYTATNLLSVSGMEHLSGIDYMSFMFASCSSLAVLDLRGFSLPDGCSLKMTFAAASSLVTVTVDADWALPTVADSYATFYNCSKIVGGNGTVYNSSRMSAAYMVIDTASTVGYLTAG